MPAPDTRRRPIAENLFRELPDGPRLVGSRCTACGEVAFPRQPSCPSCAGADTEEILLGARGTLWTWTIQRFPPPTPPYACARDAFQPFGVGYVELPEGVRVEARLTENDPAKLRIGMPMELVLETVADDDEGREVVSFAFRPA
jgi:uncharacterized OB-fold protein